MNTDPENLRQMLEDLAMPASSWAEFISTLIMDNLSGDDLDEQCQDDIIESKTREGINDAA